MIRSTHRFAGLAAGALLTVACAGDAPRVALGPADGHDLPALDTGRVAVGDVAPDFALQAWGADPIRLSDYRGKKDVILVFYRGYW